MLAFAPVVTEYREGSHLRGRPLHVADNFSVRINPELPDGQQLTMFNFASGPFAVALRDDIAARLNLDGDSAALASEATFRALLAARGVQLSNPEYSFYIDRATRPLIEAEPDARSIRILTSADAAAFAEFEAANSPEDIDEAYVELDHWVVMGAAVRDRIVGAASMYPWRGTALADIGVIVRPDARGAGHARSLVRALAREAYRRGYEPQYRCDVVNDASRALASSSGFTLYGTWEPIAQSEAQGA